MPFHPNFRTLPPSQRRAWAHLAPLRDLGFCLYGGTALALRYGHRKSVDFDFFSSKPLDKARLREALPFLAAADVVNESANAYVVLAVPPGGRGRVKLSFFGGLSFGRVGIPELSADGIVLAASVRDLLATKLKVLLDRVEPKDYIDIAEMLKRGASLADGLRDARALFPALSPMACLKSLCYFEEKELSVLGARMKARLAKSAGAVYSASPDLSASPLASSRLTLSAAELADEIRRAGGDGAHRARAVK